MSPLEWLESSQDKCKLMSDTDISPQAYFDADQGHVWLLTIADGMRALLAYCVAAGGDLVVFTDSRDGVNSL